MNRKVLFIGARNLLSWALLFCTNQANAQNLFAGFEHLFTIPKSYVVSYTSKAPLIDGDLDDTAWEMAQWTDAFVDIEGDKKPKPRYGTKVKMLWTDSCIYIAAQMEEPHVWASLQQRDTIIYYDNDFEVFIDPNNDTHQYFEIEVNVHNTILDLFMTKPYRNGGAAMLSYNATGMQSAVKIKGTLNEPADKDKCWIVEMAIPFSAIYIGNQWRSPKEGALWRMNFSRVQWESEVIKGAYIKKKDNQGKMLPESNWVWSPQGVINMHFPERWGYLFFTKETKHKPSFVLPADEKRRTYLWLLYYKQKAFYSKNRKYASSLKDLGLTDQVQVDGIGNKLSMEVTSRQFSGYITDQHTTLSINDEGLVQLIKNTL